MKAIKKGDKVHVKFRKINGLLDDVEFDGIVQRKIGPTYIIVSDEDGNKFLATIDEIKIQENQSD